MGRALEHLQNDISQEVVLNKPVWKVVFTGPQGDIIFSDGISLEMRWEYSQDKLPVFIGYAQFGTGEDIPNWIVQKITYKSGLPAKRQVIINIRWTDRKQEFEEMEK